MQHSVRLDWGGLKVKSQFVKALNEKGLLIPTPIQEKAIPLILAGQRVIGIAPTGTGKTAAYLLPFLCKLNYAQGESPRLLILAPTKELVIQIAYQAKLLTQYSDLRVVELYGGVGMQNQLNEISKGVDVLVATPGRFMEIYLKNTFNTKLIKSLVIDEADRMFDMNFIPQLRRILEVLPSKRQDALFSATFSKKVERMAQEFMDMPVKVEVSPQATVTSQVSQLIYDVPNFKTKLNLLIHFFQGPSFKRVIIFARSKESVINITKYLERFGVGVVVSIHSNKSQNARINSLKLFNGGEARTLISTDVSARGLDFKNVSHVINFDVPILYEDYVHRIGRTGRATNTGESITFAIPSDVYHIAKIETLIDERIPKGIIPDSIRIEDTLPEEARQIARDLDRQKQIADPTYQGAFHKRKS